MYFGNVDHILISAFVEHWHPETNRFHFPLGEMTVTLHDVQVIMGLAIEGYPCVKPNKERIDDVFNSIFGWDEEFIERPELVSGGKNMKLSDLMAYLRHMIEDGTDRRSIAKVFLWYTMSCSLFVRKQLSKLRIDMLSLFDDLDRVEGTAWGTAVLADLYRQLRIASRKKTKWIGGCQYLLMVWIWSYFPYFSVNPNHKIRDVNDPRKGARYLVERTTVQKQSRLQVYRMILDEYRPEDVRWMPHGQLDFKTTYRASTYRGTVRFLDIVEPYMPDRVVRQFGRIQSRPLDVIKPSVAYRSQGGRGKRQYFLEFGARWDGWDHLEEHLCADILDSPCANPGWAVERSYLEWFLTVSHPYVSPSSQVSPPPAHFPPTPMDMTRRIAMVTARARDVLTSGKSGVDDWKFVLEVLTTDRPLTVDPLERSLVFSSIYERGESSRTTADRENMESSEVEPSRMASDRAEADRREAERAEAVVLRGLHHVHPYPYKSQSLCHVH